MMNNSTNQTALDQRLADSRVRIMGQNADGNDTPSGDGLQRTEDGGGDSSPHNASILSSSEGGLGDAQSGGKISRPRNTPLHSSSGDDSVAECPPPLSPATPGGGGMRPVLQWSSSMLQSISEEEVLTLMEGRNLQEIISSMPPCQCDTCLMDEEAESLAAQSQKPVLKRQSSWKKIRSIVRWSPFIQVFKKHRYPWIQLAGHQGNFQAGDAGCVLKKLDKREHQSLQRLMGDCLHPFVPQFRGVTQRDGEQYVQLQDLLCEFSSPYVMDVKMGVRTFLESEIMAAKHNPTLRKDMYKKMTEVDPEAPTEEERTQKAVTKHRYMQWRDQMSSSVNLGFRIEGIKNGDGSSNKDFKKTKTRDHVMTVFRAFFGESKTMLTDYLQRLQVIARTQESSEFFQSHELIGSSLLFVHDNVGTVGVWMIDFGKTQPLPDGVSITHRATWEEGNHEDGYLMGLDNIVSIMQDLLATTVE